MAELDDATTYSLFLIFGENTDSDYSEVAAADEAVRALEEFDHALRKLREAGVELRGLYDLTGGNGQADPSVLIWARSANADDLQWANRQFLRVFSRYFHTAPVYSQLAIELTDVEPEAGGWLSIVDAVDAPAPGGTVQPIAERDAELGEEDAASVVSLHAAVGVGEQRYLAVAEAESPLWLVGDPLEPLDGELVVAGDASTGRWISASEVFEVLR